MAWPLILLQALAAAAPAIEQQRARDKQSDELVRGLQAQRQRQRDADAAVSQAVKDRAESRPDEERTESQAGFVSALRQSQARREGSSPATPGASDRFTTDTAAASDEAGDYGRRSADLLSRIDAPGYQRQGEGEATARLGLDLGQIGRFAQGDQFLSELRRRRIQPNPWVAALSSLAGTAAANWPGSATDPTAHLMPGAAASSTQRQLPTYGVRSA